MPLHALELVPDDAGLEAVRGEWQRLRDAGLPSQLDHRGPTNAPHLTVVSARALPDDAVDIAKVRLGNLLPVRARLGGLLVLGGDRTTVARSVELDDDVVRRVLAVRVQVPDRWPARWLPHVTLARGLEGPAVGEALAVLRPEPLEVTFCELRRWDPDAGRVTTVAQGRRSGDR